MKNLLYKIYQSEKMLAVIGILFFVMMGSVFAFGVTDAEVDTDGDTVADIIDQCPGTVVDKPTQELGVNHHIWLGDGYFTVLANNKRDKDKVQSEYSMLQTKGCSCGDIIKAIAKNQDTVTDTKFGCTNGTMGSWVKSVGG